MVDTERLPKDTKGWWVPERVIHVPPDNGHLIQLGKEALTKRQGKFKDAKPSFNETEVELNMENPIAMLPNGSQIALTQFISEGRTASKFIGEFTITDLDGRYIHFSAEAGKNEPLGVSDTRDKISDRMIYTVTVPEQDLSGFPDDKLRVKVKCEPRPLDASYTTDPMMNAHGQPEILPGVYRLSR